MRRLQIFVSTLAIGLMAGTAVCQGDRPPRLPGAGGPPGAGEPGVAGPHMGGRPAPLDPEKVKAAWELQARGVAKQLALPEQETSKLVMAYIDARQSHQAALEKAREEAMEKARQARKQEGNDDDDAADRPRAPRGMREMQKIMAEVRKSESEKLQASLGKFLSSEQTTKAMASLGTFDRGWDMMVGTIIGFNLEEAKINQALPAIQKYVVAASKARESTDRDAMRTALSEARDQLVDSMKKVLDEGQMNRFQRSIAAGNFPGRPGMGEEPPPSGDNTPPARGRRGGGAGAPEQPGQR